MRRARPVAALVVVTALLSGPALAQSAGDSGGGFFSNMFRGIFGGPAGNDSGEGAAATGAQRSEAGRRQQAEQEGARERVVALRAQQEQERRVEHEKRQREFDEGQRELIARVRALDGSTAAGTQPPPGGVEVRPLAPEPASAAAAPLAAGQPGSRPRATVSPPPTVEAVRKRLRDYRIDEREEMQSLALYEALEAFKAGLNAELVELDRDRFSGDPHANDPRRELLKAQVMQLEVKQHEVKNEIAERYTDRSFRWDEAAAVTPVPQTVR